jgi:hypothetical protein
MVNKWSDREDIILKILYPTATISELEKKIPRHNITSIYARAHVLGLKRILKDRSKTKGVRRSY